MALLLMSVRLTSPFLHRRAAGAWMLGASLLAGAPLTSAALTAPPVVLALTNAVDIGSTSVPGTVTALPDGIRLTAAGEDLGGTSDHCFFLCQTRAGDFDVKVRVANLTAVDVWTKAGLLARETLEPTSPFAAVLTTPALSGTFFSSRAASGASASMTGAFPANLPNSWLRLVRTGQTFTGYASIDGGSWQRLGGSALALTNEVWLGLVVASHQPQTAATAEFRDLGEAGAQPGSASPLTREAIGPCSRRTGLVISEVMHTPAGGFATEENLEFIELFNANPFYEDISQYKLAGDIDFVFPLGTILPGGGFVLVAKNPAVLAQATGLGGILGPYIGALPPSGTVRLHDKPGSILLEIPYSNAAPWPVAAESTGHSLVLARPSYGEGQAAAWDRSRLKGGSPGQVDAMLDGPLEHVVINEVLANGTPGDDYIELHNRGSVAVDLSGCTLSDLPGAARFRIPAGTVIQPFGFTLFTQGQLGFGLEWEGETVYLGSPDDRRVLDAVRFEAQARGTTLGRFPDGTKEFYVLSRSSAGMANAAPMVPEVIINEIMYHPLSNDPDDGYLELYNRGTAPVDLSGWRLTDGVEFQFPPGTRLLPGDYLTVARNVARLRLLYPNLTQANSLGDLRGRLSGSGERIALIRPERNANDPKESNYVLVEEVTYGTGGSWGRWADGGGSSLERVDSESNARRAASWADSDESAKAPWTTVEVTGTLRDGAGTPDALQLLMLAEGECLVDNVEVLVSGVATNLLLNPRFDAGMGQWNALGDHIRSNLDLEGGPDSSACLHVRATNQGEPLANHVRTIIRQPSLLAGGKTATLRARVRWLCGSPEMILRVKGNYLEAFGRLLVPRNLGTPSARNSRSRPEAGPSIDQVTHYPVLPAVGEPIVVTARVEDRHGLAQVHLHYRVDPSTGYATVPMLDDGTGGDRAPGDGIYSGVIPGPEAAALVAFSIEAECQGEPSVKVQFPADAPARECLVRFGESIPASSFGTYRLWFTTATVRAWSSRAVLSNEELDGTFVYGNERVVYNIGARYSGSPWHQGVYNSPVGNICTYAFRTPGEQLVLGTTSFNKLHALGNTPGDDSSLQREQVAYWMVRQLGLPWNYQRYVQVFVNGVRRGPLMEDTQVPGGDSLRQHYPDDPDGQLFKLNGWYEAESVGGASFRLASWCTLNQQAGGVEDAGRYRWNWAARASGNSANEFGPVFALVAAANAPEGAPHEQILTGIADIPQWMRTFAIEHAVGNWDSFGNRNAQNMYAYKPTRGPWRLHIWDYNIVLGNSSSDGPSGDDLFQINYSDRGMRRIYNNSSFVRIYLRTLDEIARGPLLSANVDPIIDARFAAFRAGGISASSPGSLKNWISNRRRYLQNYLTNYHTEFVLTAPAAPTATTDQNWIDLVGLAPLSVAEIQVNGQSYPVTWTNLFQWVVHVPLKAPDTTLQVQACHSDGSPMAGLTATVAVRFTGSNAPTQLVINEIMHHPDRPGAEFIEIYNRSERSACDLSDLRLSGAAFELPQSVLLLPKAHAVVTGDREAFLRAYGSEVAPIGQFTETLNPNGALLRLLWKGAASLPEELVDEVAFHSQLPWPAAALEPGVALQLSDPAFDNAIAANWVATTKESVERPEWKFVSVTGSALTASTLLLYHSPFQPPPDPLDFSGRWVGAIQVQGQSVAMTTEFDRTLAGGWAGQFISDGGSVPLVVDVASKTNLSFRFPPAYGTVSWQGGLTPDGATISGSFSQTVQGGQTLRGSFALRRFQDPDQALGGSVFIDDLSLVAGRVANLGPNLVRNGDFERPLEGDWHVGSNHLASAISSDQARSGRASLHLIASRGGADTATALWQELAPLVPGQTYTLSYWYLPAVFGKDVTVRTADHAIVSSHSIRLPRTATPGKPNTVGRALPPLPPVFLSEIQVENATGPQDEHGEREPWLELFNAGAVPVNLEGYCLSDSLEHPERWSFPSGASIPAGGYLWLWLDGAESTPTALHATFRPAATGGWIVLSAAQGGQVRLVDALQYPALAQDESYGLFIDESGRFERRLSRQPTPGTENLPRETPALVVINEWMASNTRTLPNPVGGRFDDWIELHNPNPLPVDLSGCFLTDNPADLRKWQFPPGTQIAAHGYLLIWADEQSELNGGHQGLHADFKLSLEGETIRLSSPDGSLIDSVLFGPQAADISQGRWPESGGTQIASFGQPTPGSANGADSSETPVRLQILALGESGLVLQWSSMPGQLYQVQFQDALGAGSWTNASGTILASGSVSRLVDPAALARPSRFYRVITVE